MILQKGKHVESVNRTKTPSTPILDDAPLSIPGRRCLAESILGSIEWIDDVTGYSICPGAPKHTTKAGERDCRVKIDGVPTLSCVHASCVKEIKAANKALRSQTLTIDPVPLTPDLKKAAAEAKAKAARERQLQIQARMALPNILKNYAWPYDKIVADSPVLIDPEDRRAMVNTFLNLYGTDDVIWIGNVTDTGKAQHAAHFKTRAQWQNAPLPEGPLTCPACFIPGSVSRSKENVAQPRYLVVESDSLSKDQVGAIFRWLNEAVGLPLRAVVDTAGKSLHGWFDYPPPEVLTELKVMLPAMGCDPKLFGSSQPCRLPGGLRDGQIQRLIFSANGGAQ